MNLTELGLTPAQYAEMQELEEELVQAWLAAVSASSGLRSPVGWFLAGVRSGTLPGAVPDNKRLREVHLAESWIRNAGLFEPDEASLLDALFGEHGRLRSLDAPELRARMLSTWRSLQPAAAQVEHERIARAERWKRMNVPVPYPHSPQAQHSSHSTGDYQSLAARDIDADIDWQAA